MPELYLGVDAGNSKTLAAVADSAGRILGWARGGLGDIYGASVPAHAIGTVLNVVQRALTSAGADAGDVASAAFRLAGVDWPEDEALWVGTLQAQLGGIPRFSVKNDGYALLRCGAPDGVGVAVSLGTGAAMAGRGRTGQEFMVSWWFQHYLGAAGLGSDAIRASMLAELGLGEQTSLSAALNRFYGVASVEELLHAFTRREGALDHFDKGRAARIVLAEAEADDAVAAAIAREHADRTADYIRVCMRRIGLGGKREPVTVVLGGSVLASTDSYFRELVETAIGAAVPEAVIAATRSIPVLGAVLDAIAEGGIRIDESLQSVVLSAEPSADLLAT